MPIGSTRLSQLKVTVPGRAAGQIRRAGLVEKALPARRRVTVIKAPAGFGKTTLLAQCCGRLGEEGVPIAWISLDEGDGPAVLDAHIALACGSAGLDMQDAPDRDDAGDAVLSSAGLAAHAAAALEGPFVLAFDDVDRLRSPESLAQLEFLVNYGPANLHLAMTCRELPVGLNLGKALLDGHASVLGAEELRFSQPEIEEFLGSGLSQKESAKILDKTAGWPIAVRIFHDGAKDAGPGGGETLRDFVANWMDSNLFGRLEPEDRDLLFDIGLFERIDADLLGHVLQLTDAARRLDSLSALDGLLEPVPGGADRRQLHPLIREHCVRRRHRDDPERFKSINLRLAAALRRRGDTAAAARHAIEAGERRLAGDILEEAGGAGMLFRQGPNRFTAAHRLLDDALVSDRPRLKLFRCLGFALTGRFAEARESHAAAADAMQARPGNPDNAGFDFALDDYAVRSAVLLSGSEPITSQRVEALRSDLSRFEESQRLDPLTRGHLQLCLCAGYQLTARFDAARAIAWQARKNLADNPYANALVDLNLGQTAMAQGRVADAQRHYQNVRRIAGKMRSHEALPAAAARILLEELALECGRLAPRPHFLRMPRGAALLTKSFPAQAAAAAIGIELNLRHKGAAGALAAANALQIYCRAAGLPPLARYVTALKISVFAANGQVAEAEREWSLLDLPEAPDDCLDLDGQTWREMEALSCARLRLMIAQGRFDEGRGFAADLRAAAASRGARRTLMRALSLSIALERQAGDGGEEFLVDFLRLFGESPYAWPMVRDREANEPVVDAYSGSAAASPDAENARRLLAAMGPPEEFEPPLLTGRQLRILDRLSSHQDKQIARDLGLSPFGVRYHIRKIFAELGVSKRADAVRRAEELNLLVGKLQ